MKRTVTICICLALLLGQAGCGRETGDDEHRSIRIGIAMYDQYDTYIRELVTAFGTYAQEVQREQDLTISILKEGADSNQAVQNNQVETFIESGCDILLVNLVDRTDAAVIIDQAEMADIPVIFFNRELVEEDLQRWDKLYYVGGDALDSGRMQGEIVVSLYEQDPDRLDRSGDGKIQYVMLEGEAGHQDATLRTEYSVNTVTEAGIELERLEDEIANWSRSQAETKMAGFIRDHGTSIELVFANNDEMAIGAINALEKADISEEDWPAIVGLDGTADGIQAVLDGRMVGTVLNDGQGQARAMLEIALALTTGSEMPELVDGKYVRLPYQVITRDNVGDYLDD